MTYEHTQRAPLHWLLVIPGTAMVVTAWQLSEPAWVAPLISIVGSIMIVLSLCFRHLRVRDRGEALEVGFGPLPWFRRSVAYARLRAVTPERSTLLDGWGIHYSVGRGWIWNLWGFDCVALDLKDGGRVRIGTDDVEGLATFLQTRLPKEDA